MTINEAIEYYTKAANQRELADKEKGDYDKWNETRFMTKKQSVQEIADNRHLAAWLKELKEVKRLLKLSLEQTNPKCKYCIHDLEDEQKGYNPCCTGEIANCKWIHADEAEKLLGGSNEHRS